MKKNDVNFYDHHQLKFSILESDAVINHQGLIEVKLVISNKSNCDWGTNFKIKGCKEQEEIRDLDQPIGKIIKTDKLSGIKFSFTPNVNM